MFDSSPLTLLAQDGPPAPDEAVSMTGAAGDGTSPAGPAPSSSPFGNPVFGIMIVVLAGMILFSIFGQRKERKKRESLISSVKKHDRVRTIGGVIGSIVEVKGDEVVLKVDESSNTRITFARSAVQEVVASKGALESDG